MTRPPAVDAVHWTEDGTEPTAESKLVDGPIVIDVPATFKARGFVDGKPATFVTTRDLG